METDNNGIQISKKNGIVVKTRAFSIALDPKRASNCDYTFVSHAHIDHVHSPNGKSKIIASKETAILAKARGYNLGEVTESAPGIELIDAGHILGSRAILIDGSVLYTGDFSRRDRGFLKGLSGIKCDTLIMETTYGKPHYRFRETSEIVAQVSKLIAECFHQCRPVVLTGYPLGKAQLLSFLFNKWDPIYVHESVHKMNAAHIELGVGLREYSLCQVAANGKSASGSEPLTRRPWIMIAPTSMGRLGLIQTLRQEYDAVILGFTGWSLDPGFRYSSGMDYTFDISDHSDHEELVQFVKECNPSKIYTVHGFASEFATFLRRLGFEAEPLDGNGSQETLSRYA